MIVRAQETFCTYCSDQRRKSGLPREESAATFTPTRPQSLPLALVGPCTLTRDSARCVRPQVPGGLCAAHNNSRTYHKARGTFEHWLRERAMPFTDVPVCMVTDCAGTSMNSQGAAQLSLACLEGGMPLQYHSQACCPVGAGAAAVSAGAPVPSRPIARVAAPGSAVRRAADGPVGTCPGTSLDPRRDQPPHHGRHPGRHQHGPAHQAAPGCRPYIGEPAVRRPRRIQRVLRDHPHRPHRPGTSSICASSGCATAPVASAGICPAASISAQSASPGCARRCVIG